MALLANWRRLGRPSWREWLGFAAGLVAFVSLFLTWTSLSTNDPVIAEALREVPASDVFRTGWSTGFLGWFPTLTLFAVGLTVVVIGRISAVRKAGLPQLWLLAAILSINLLVLGWWLIGWQFDEEQRAFFDQVGISIDAGVGRYLCAVSVVCSLVASVLDIRALRGSRVGTKKR